MDIVSKREGFPMWEKQLVNTNRGTFEIFSHGVGEPLCITHLYSEFNELGYYFADEFVNQFKVYLINLKEAGSSCKAQVEAELSMRETAKDLESIRETLNFDRWGFAGHSTGGMLGLVYAGMFPESLTKLLVGGASASKKYMEHEDSMYCLRSPLNKRIKEIFSVLKSPASTKEERRNANREWTNMSLYYPERRDKYFIKPSSGKVVQKRLDYYSFNDLPSYDLKSELNKIAVPSIVFCGKHDAQCPVIFSQEINNELKNSTLYIFEESNHFPYIEEKEKFKEMVADFKGLASKSHTKREI
jgi:pimeloyl-ACP methyl ester carboxylesterase